MKALYLLLTILLYSFITQAQLKVEPHVGAGFQVRGETFEPLLLGGINYGMLHASVGISTLSVHTGIGVNLPYTRVSVKMRIPTLPYNSRFQPDSLVSGQFIFSGRIHYSVIEVEVGGGVEVSKNKASPFFQFRFFYRFETEKERKK